MLKVAMICMLVAVVALAVGVSLMRKNNYLSFLLKTLTIIALVCLGFVVANYKDDFSGFSILVILSVLPMILAAFDLKLLLGTKNGEIATQTTQETNAQNEAPENTEDITTTPINKKEKNANQFAKSNGHLFAGIGMLLSTICLSIASLYIGKETYFGAIIGILLGLGSTCALLAIKKYKNPYDILAYVLIFTAAGLCVSNIVLALLYSFAMPNIMFSLGNLLFAVYAIIHVHFNKNFLTPIYYASVVLLFLSILL